MVSTRTRGTDKTSDSGPTQTGRKRSAPSTSSTKAKPVAKKSKPVKNGKLEVGTDGEVGLKQEESKEEGEEDKEDKEDVPGTPDGQGGNKENKEEKSEQVEEVDRSGDAPGGTEEKDPVASDKEDEEQEVKRSGLGETKQEVRHLVSRCLPLLIL
jgi:hypothetical protein